MIWNALLSVQIRTLKYILFIDVNCLEKELPKHSDLFANDVENQLKVATILQDRLQRRNQLLKNVKSTSI